MELAEAIEGVIRAEGGSDGVFTTPLADLRLIRFASKTSPAHLIYKPALCVVAQGGKHALFGDRAFAYGAMQALVVTIDVPASSRVREAGPGQPFLGLTLDLDLSIMREVMAQLHNPPHSDPNARGSVFVIDVGEALAGCVLRLVHLLQTPEALPVLRPSIMREICYWLLTGPHGQEVSEAASPDGCMPRIAQAISILRQRYDQPVRVAELAKAACMSHSTFHHHFKALTSLSPLQYQKQLRLLEARRLMLEAAANVETAAFSVGYESASQFSREYAQRFGTSPKRDMATLRAHPETSAQTDGLVGCKV